MKDMKDETKAACPIACPYCHANAGFDRERMNGIRTCLLYTSPSPRDS